jgi:hypothetical protein
VKQAEVAFTTTSSFRFTPYKSNAPLIAACTVMLLLLLYPIALLLAINLAHKDKQWQQHHTARTTSKTYKDFAV